ncbi:MAG: transglutaminase-like domain-containing protein [Nanoarchaeota archaeon]
MKVKYFILFGLIILVLISFFVWDAQKDACRFKEDCPDRTCFMKDCIDNSCSYSQMIPCCEKIPCCGNGECETEERYLSCRTEECETDTHVFIFNDTIIVLINGTTAIEFIGETHLTCSQDCPNPKDALEENIPEIKEYPKLEQVFIDLYADVEFSDSEMKYMKSLFDIFKLKTSLHQADEEVLAYLVTNIIEPDIFFGKSRAMDMEYFVEELIPLANDITEGSSGEMESIEKIVSWVRGNINVTWTAAYELEGDTPKAILENREVWAHCDYWATLITAFCRASGIPAREVEGRFASPPEGHAWTEAYVNGEWIMVDSTGVMELYPEEKQWLYSVYAYDPLSDTLMDVSLSYNTDILDLIIEHTKEAVGETSATGQAEELFAQYKKESDLVNKYAYAQDIMETCISEIIAKQEGYESKDIKVLDLWDWNKLKTEEAFLSELDKAKAISIYDITSHGGIQYMSSGAGEFPLEKISTLIPEIKQLFQGEIYSFFAHYEAGCGSLSDAVAINLFDPEDVGALETAYQDLVTGTPELIKDFVIEIVSVVSKEKNYTTFHLPEYIQEGAEYSIVIGGGFDRENTAFNIKFDIQSMVIVKDIMIIFSADQTTIMINIDVYDPDALKYMNWSHFDNLKLINEEGEVYADPEIYRNPRPDPTVVIGPPYNLDDAPYGFITPDQTLEIYREDDIVVIKGDMTTEQIVVE